MAQYFSFLYVFWVTLCAAVINLNSSIKNIATYKLMYWKVIRESSLDVSTCSCSCFYFLFILWNARNIWKMAAELVNYATSDKLPEMDWTKNIEICELVARDQRWLNASNVWIFFYGVLNIWTMSFSVFPFLSPPHLLHSCPFPFCHFLSVS